ncbi:TonB-dependent receptor domain-containing protein [Actinobacillus delphinicola]|uniref:Iron-regulated outer membrane protein n=1 Tax=Actinobacillus delphinicola TaxID=51161 RepID=A0A448TUG0_9PAST|nr:TonB-dependent receptor [Actinobacillus delphinicola]VEJ09481.1 iron-regulated outer membrane protein [Actinobacillus delphinicola]
MKLSKIYTALFLTMPAIAMADDTPTTLNEISVVALRDASTYAKEANKTVVLDNNQIQVAQASSVAQALKNVPNMSIEGGDRAINQKPDIRGLTGNRVAQVIDGVKQNFELKNRGSYFLPMSMVQSVEVIKGPASTLWGNGALGGVVAMRTPTALDLLDDGQDFGAKVNQGYHSANQLSETSAMVYAANDNFDALLGGFYNHANNLRLGDGQHLPNSGYIQKGGLAKLGWQIDDANRVTVSHRLVRISQTSPNDNNLLNGKLAQDTPVGTKGLTFKQFMELAHGARNGLHMVNYKYSPLSHQTITDQNTTLDYAFDPESKYIDSHVTLYRNHTVEREHWLVDNVNDKTKYVTNGFNIRNSSDFDWLYLTYGVDFAHNKINTVREKNVNVFESKYRPSGYNGKSDNTGVFLQGYVPLFNKSLVLSPGIRYDHYRTKAEGHFQSVTILPSKSMRPIPQIIPEDKLNDPKLTDHHYSPSFAVTWKPAEFFTLGIKYNEAFRAPSLQESFANGYLFGIKLDPISMQNGIKQQMINGMLQGMIQGMKKQGVPAAQAEKIAQSRLPQLTAQVNKILEHHPKVDAYPAQLYPNVHLKPEIARNKEIDANFHFQDVFTSGDKWDWSAAFFRNDIKNMIEPHLSFGEQMAVAEYVNLPKARITGFEVGTHYRNDYVGLGVSYGQMYGKVTETDHNNLFLKSVNVGDPLDNIPANKLSVSADYYFIPNVFNVGTIVTYHRNQNRVSSTYERNWGDGTPFKHYTLTEIHTTYAPKDGTLKDLRIDFSIDNLFDQSYRPAFSLMNGAGRNFKLNIGYKF